MGWVELSEPLGTGHAAAIDQHRKADMAFLLAGLAIIIGIIDITALEFIANWEVKARWQVKAHHDLM